MNLKKGQKFNFLEGLPISSLRRVPYDSYVDLTGLGSTIL